MDQVLMSVKKTFTDEDVSAAMEIIPPRQGARLPDSVRAQQQRLTSTQSRRTKLPALPPSLRERERARPARASSFPSRRPRTLQSDVPRSVEVNAVAAQPARVEIEPQFRWGDRRQRLATEVAQALTASVPLTKTPVTDRATTAAPRPRVKKVQSFERQPSRAPVTDQDWDELKSNLRQALDTWIDAKKAAQVQD